MKSYIIELTIECGNLGAESEEIIELIIKCGNLGAESEEIIELIIKNDITMTSLRDNGPLEIAVN